MTISLNKAVRISLSFLVIIFIIGITLPAKADTNTIKYLDFMGLILFDGEINGHRGKFLLDTGADSTIVDTRFAQKIGLKSVRSPLAVLGFGAISEYNVDKVVLGEWYFKDLQLVGMDLSIIDKYLGLPIVAIVGGDFLKNYVLSIDYQKSVFILSDEFPKIKRNAISVPFELREKLVFVKARSGTDNQPRTFLVDTGATSTVYFKNRMEESNPEYRNWPNSKGWIEVSFMGPKNVDLVVMPSFWVGDMGIESMVTIVSDPGLLGLGINIIAGSPTHGIVGWTFLKNFRVIFDYPNQILIFEPYEYYVERWPYLFDTVGLMVAFKDGRPYVEHLIPETPAARSNVKVNDLLIKIDNLDVTRMNGLEISELVMGEPGTQVSFVFERDGKQFRITMIREHLFSNLTSHND